MKRQQAVVIGAGFAGLIAAQVLSNHFDSVVVIEKDPKVGSNTPRPGAPQGSHLHVLLGRGQEILGDLFPGIYDVFTGAGCPRIDWAQDTTWETRLGRFPRYKSGVVTSAFSRPFLESTLYSFVSKKSNVAFVRATVESVEVGQGLASAITCLDGDIFAADLVVLAGGQHFPIGKMLSLNADEIKTESSPIHITYRSVQFEAASLNLKDEKQYYYQFSLPKDSLGAVISPIEQSKYVATIVQYGAVHKGKIGYDEFLGLAAAVPGRKFYEIIKDAKPLTEVSVFHKSAMFLRTLHKVQGIPVNVFAMGDVFCSLNPVFGQGMTVALEQALILKELLSDSQVSSRTFHKQSLRKARLPFLLSKISFDSRAGFAQRYLEKFLLRCQDSRDVHRGFLEVLHLQSSSFKLFSFKALFSTLLKGNTND